MVETIPLTKGRFTGAKPPMSSVEIKQIKFINETNGLSFPKEGQHVDQTRNLKGGIGSLFDPCINAMGRWPYCPSRMEVSYCTFRFGTIIWRDMRTLSLPRDSRRDNLNACMI